MTAPAAYRLEWKAGDYCFATAADYERTTNKESAQVYGLFLEPQPLCSQEVEVYLGPYFIRPKHCVGGMCPNNAIPLYLGPCLTRDTSNDAVRHKVDDLMQRLMKFYWSPSHPATYTLPHPQTGKTVGIGLIAMRDPAAFNMTHAAISGDFSTVSQHQRAVELFVSYEKLEKVEVGEQSLSEWITLLSESEFRNWITNADNSKLIPEPILKRICTGLRVPQVRRV